MIEEANRTSTKGNGGKTIIGHFSRSYEFFLLERLLAAPLVCSFISFASITCHRVWRIAFWNSLRFCTSRGLVSLLFFSPLARRKATRTWGTVFPCFSSARNRFRALNARAWILVNFRKKGLVCLQQIFHTFESMYSSIFHRFALRKFSKKIFSLCFSNYWRWNEE